MLNQQLLPSQEIKDGMMEEREEEEVEGDRIITIVGQEVCDILACCLLTGVY